MTTNMTTDISDDTASSGDAASPLTNRAEAFCAAYARRPHGADAAREAGYGAADPARQASRLLIRPEIRARIAELSAGWGDQRAELAGGLTGKLEPVYDAALAAGDLDTVLQTVELQARIQGLVHGGATIRPRSGGRAPRGAGGGGPSHEEVLASLA